MRGFILAAGFGTRLQPITDHIPKALVPVCGKPLLDRALSFCISQGVSEIGVNSHYLHQRLEEHRDRSAVPYALFHEDGVIKGTGGGLYNANDFLAGDEMFFVCNADIVYRFDLVSCVQRFRETGWTACLLAVPAAGGGTIMYEKHSRGYRGTPGDGPVPGGCASADFIGAALYRREFIGLLRPDDFSVVPVWKRAVEQGHGVGVMTMERCYWRDVGTPASLAAVHFDRLDGAHDLDLPEYLEIDREAKRCFHCDLPASVRERLGQYSWVEMPDFPSSSRMVRSIVFYGAHVGPNVVVEQCIVTPFGEVAFGT